MANIFITGSTDGLGRMAAELLLEQGHKVVLHARNSKRATDIKNQVNGIKHVVIGDLSRVADMKAVAAQVNELGTFDAVIHNAAVGYQEPNRIETKEGLPQVFAVNTLAPYVLTALIRKPKRLVYLSSGLHTSGSGAISDLTWKKRRWSGIEAYSESKLHDILIAFGVARIWPDVYSNALEPGWVATKMGGPNAPDDLDKGHRTQAWLATSDDAAAKVTAQYFFHQAIKKVSPIARDTDLQDALLKACRELSGVNFPGRQED
ncbi:MAG: SDR family NAD(P)-dependent oxidoreductase [Chitinophagaceae bacterium]|nr:SDR family NAD(P)-dependent oxidoreductase [Oligoflexus sp.]